MTAYATPSYSIAEALTGLGPNGLDPPDQNDGQMLDQDNIATFVVRALYDYQSTDESSLSFRAGDFIEVLNQLETGWWDGLLDNQRGWFPSNYVIPVPEHELEQAFATTPAALSASTSSDGQLPNGHSTPADDDSEWSEEDMLGSGPAGINDLAAAVMMNPASTSTSNAFWMPEVTEDGQVYYLNHATGERSRDLPPGTDDVLDDSGIFALNRTGHTRAANGSSQNASSSAGFGVPRRTGTPEPWIRRLADDGMSYYYYNPLTGQSQWSPPSPSQHSQTRDTSSERESSRENHRLPTIASRGRLRTDSAASHSQRPSSVYSDDSEINPLGHSRSPSRPREPQTVRSTIVGPSVPLSDLTSAESAALELQQSLLPPPKETVNDLTAGVREAIAAVVDAMVNRSHISHEQSALEVARSEMMRQRVADVVVLVRNLLYVSGTLGAPASSLSPFGNVDETAESARSPLLELKPYQRKVTATLSKLVLSARAANTSPDWPQTDSTSRVDNDAAELERAIVTFASEILRSAASGRSKRLHGVLVSGESLAGVGPGLLGAGAAGRWKGLGFIPLENSVAPPQQPLDDSALNDLRKFRVEIEEKLTLIKPTESAEAVERMIYRTGRLAIAHISAFTSFVDDIDFAYYLDVEGIRPEQASSSELTSGMKEYMDDVQKARALIRALETAKQALHDDGMAAFMSLQHLSSPSSRVPSRDTWESVEAALSSAQSNLTETYDIFEQLVRLSKKQVEANQNGIGGRIGSRALYQRTGIGRDRADSTMTSTDEWYGRSRSNTNISAYGVSEDISVMAPPNMSELETALRQTAGASGRIDPTAMFYPHDPMPSAEEKLTPQIPKMDPLVDPTMSETSSMASLTETAVEGTDHLLAGSSKPGKTSLPSSNGGSVRMNGRDLLEDDFEPTNHIRPREKKLKDLLGPEAPTEQYIKQQNPDLTPWYLRPIHGPGEILVNPDGGVRGGTLPALIERLTMHDMRDATFINTFLMTFRSFATANEVFELLVQRFNIKPPENMTPEEHKVWAEKKQKPIQFRVINIFKAMVLESDLEDEPEMLDKIRDFAASVVAVTPVSKTLILVVDRAKKGDTIKMTVTTTEPPPPSYIPRRGRVKLLDIEPLELARQLTILESRLYLKITPTECLERGKDSGSDDRVDNIKNIITTANKIAEWVAESILSKEDPRRRAMNIKHFILVAERCRHLNNFSSMAALIAGLNTPPIRRLKRSWEQVNTRTIATLEDVEKTLDSGKNFNGYRQMLAKVDPPCVPFLGVYLTILVFINDGNKDILVKEGNLINFNKRQKAAEIIREIKKYQSKPYNLAPVDSIQAFIKESLTIDKSSDYFWQLSLEREPREREDEKMARLLQESGFL